MRSCGFSRRFRFFFCEKNRPVVVVEKDGRFTDKDGFQLIRAYAQTLKETGQLQVVESHPPREASHPGVAILELALVDSKLRPLPYVDGYYIVKPGTRFYIRYVVNNPKGAQLGATLDVDGQTLESVQPICQEGLNTIVTPGFPQWFKGTVVYRAFVPCSSTKNGTASATSTSIGTVSLKVLSCRYRNDDKRPSTYSSTVPVTQVTSSAVDGIKFWQRPGTSTKPDSVIYRGKPNNGTVLQELNQSPVATLTIKYDTATNLGLRGVLNRKEHSHLLPYEGPHPILQQQKRPYSDFVQVTTIDLTGDHALITTETKRRNVLDLTK